jgi:hypothetical protein
MMPISLSSELIGKMGFRPLADQEAFQASFSRILIYEARGIIPSEQSFVVVDGSIGEFSYKVWICPSINEGFTHVMNHVFAENENEWRQAKESQGPFLVIQLGPTSVYSISSGWIKKEEDLSFSTLDSFPKMRPDLDLCESVVLPRVMTTLVCKFATIGQVVSPRFLEKTNLGLTPSGELVHDFRFQGSGSGYLSSAIAEPKLVEALGSVVSGAPKLNKKAAGFFTLGIAEGDELKSFLYFFLAMEVFTHATFKSINHDSAIQAFLVPGHAAHTSFSELVHRQTNFLTNLLDRFIWCARCRWIGIGDSEISEFKELKKIRDDIAHGSIPFPPEGASSRCRALAIKLLSL